MKTKEDIKTYVILCVLSILSLVILFAVGNCSLQKAPNLRSMNIDVTDSEMITDTTSTETSERAYDIELEPFESDTAETTDAGEVTTEEAECVETDSKETTCIEETTAQSIPETIYAPEETETLIVPDTTSTSVNNDYGYYTENDIILCAKVLRGECNGMPSDTEVACVVWVILNRVDCNPGCTIADVVTAPSQFAYNSNAYVDDRFYQIASDVLSRWAREKQGEQNVGRVLPIEYRWFHGDGHHNWFRIQYEGNGQYWDYSLPSPYDT